MTTNVNVIHQHGSLAKSTRIFSSLFMALGSQLVELGMWHTVWK